METKKKLRSDLDELKYALEYKYGKMSVIVDNVEYPLNYHLEYVDLVDIVKKILDHLGLDIEYHPPSNESCKLVKKGK